MSILGLSRVKQGKKNKKPKDIFLLLYAALLLTKIIKHCQLQQNIDIEIQLYFPLTNIVHIPLLAQ